MNTRILNKSAIHEFALKCSKERRAGKFTRVSESFQDSVEADVETLIRAVNAMAALPAGFEPVTVESRFITGYLMEKVEVAINDAVARIIQKHVHRHPTLGKTLMS
jgi:hypothetical protein